MTKTENIKQNKQLIKNNLKMTTKLTFGLLLSLGVATTAFAQTGRVGVNTVTPAATLDVAGKPTVATEVDGVIIPRLTGDQLKAKDAVYLAAQTGAIVYATAAASPTTAKTINVTSAGQYYFDGTVWQKVANPSASTEPWFSKTTGTGATSNTEDIYQLGRVGIGINTNTPPVDPFFTTFEPLLVPELIVKGKGRSGIAHYDTTTGAFNIGVGSIIENVPAAAGSNTFGFANQINNSPVTANNNAHSYTANMVHNSAATQASVRNMDVNMTTAGAGKVNSADGILNSMSLSSTGGFDDVAGLRQNITSNATATGNSTGFYGINQNVNYSSPGTVGTLSGIRNSVNLNTTADITAPNFFGGVSGVNTSLNLNGSTAVPTGANVAGIRNNVFFSASGASAGTLFGINNNVFYNGTGTAALAVGTNSGTAKFAGAGSSFNVGVGYTVGVNSLNRSIGYLIGDPSGTSVAPSITTETATDPAYGFYVSTNAMYKVGGRQTWSFYSRDVNDRVFFAGNTAIGGTDLPTNKLHVTATANPLRLEGVQEYADNTAAVGAGLAVGVVYRTGDVLKIVH